MVEAQVDDLLLSLLEQFDATLQEAFAQLFDLLCVSGVIAPHDAQLVVLEVIESASHIDAYSELL